MSQPKKAFNEVRAILGKLDRSREELRQKPGSQNLPPISPNQTIGTAQPPQAPGAAARPSAAPGVQAAPQKAAPAAPPSPGSRFGRAQPIRPSTDNALGRWNAPGQ